MGVEDMRKGWLMVLAIASVSLCTYVALVSAAADPVLLNVPDRPVRFTGTPARIVTNQMARTLGTYAAAPWATFVSGTGTKTVTYDDTAKTVTSNVESGCVTCRAWGEFTFTSQPGQTYILSYTVTAYSLVGVGSATREITIAGGTCTGTCNADVIILGRQAVVFTTATAVTTTVRLGIGTSSGTSAEEHVTFGNVMLEALRGEERSRVYPYEYVPPGDSRAFNYTYTATMSGTSVTNPVLGTAYTIPKYASVLAVGDSFCNDIAKDYPYLLRNENVAFQNGYPSSWAETYPLPAVTMPRLVAISERCVSGATLPAITANLVAALAETYADATVSPWTVVLLEGGVNDVSAGATLESMQAQRLAQIAAVVAYRAIPVLVGVGPFDGTPAPKQAVLDGFNAWMRTLGYPMYDMYLDANSGSATWKANWVTPDGTHPGTNRNEGQSKIAIKLANLLLRIK